MDSTKMWTAVIIVIGLIAGGLSSNNTSSSRDIDKILKAKAMVRSLSNYPDTVVFHEMNTAVNGNIVTLKFTCKNAFGVSETLSLDMFVE